METSFSCRHASVKTQSQSSHCKRLSVQLLIQHLYLASHAPVFTKHHVKGDRVNVWKQMLWDMLSAEPNRQNINKFTEAVFTCR